MGSLVSGTPYSGVATILELIDTVALAATERFKAADHFGVNMEKMGLCISLIGGNFRENFLHKVEDDAEGALIKVHKICKASSDISIIKELGDNHEMKLGKFCMMLYEQPQGEHGPLLVNGCANIAFIRDMSGKLWSVFAFWNSSSRGWSIDARSVQYPYEWEIGRQILSR
jgi:hypothetical protein